MFFILQKFLLYHLQQLHELIRNNILKKLIKFKTDIIKT